MVRIATWNLERPRQRSHRNARIRERIQTLDADIWVLTETNAVIDLSRTHTAVASVPVPSLHAAGENWTTVWSRFPARPVETYDPTIAVCASLAVPGHPMLVYGTVLPWATDRGPSGQEKNWAEHYRVIEAQGHDWRRLRKAFPDHHFCVAGDFNQSRDGRRWPWGEWYGTAKGRQQLTAEMKSAGLRCVTEEDFVSTGKLATCSTIDHISFNAEVVPRVRRVDAWEAWDAEGIALSDHNGVFVDVDLETGISALSPS